MYYDSREEGMVVTKFSIKVAHLLIWTGVISVMLLLAYPSHLNALPFPKKLVAESTLSHSQAAVVFQNIASIAPEDTRHLYIEILAATETDNDRPATLTATLNDNHSPNYINRLLFATEDQINTQLHESDSAANLMNIPPADGQRFGGGSIFIPWSFLDDQKKHLLTHSAANESHISTQMAHWSSLEPVSSIHFRLADESNFAVGSSFRIYAVDESYRIQDAILPENQADIGFRRLSQEHSNLIVIGQTRSSEVNPNRRGDRVWYSINNDNQAQNYQIQRLTGEAAGSYQPGVATEPNRIIDNQMNEPRVGWNSAESAPRGVYGPWLLYYPDYTNTATWRTFLSRHGVYDNHWNPIGNEIGRHTDTASIRELRFRPQRGSEFTAGSRVGIYRSAEPSLRYVVAEGGRRWFLLTYLIPQKWELYSCT